jgi:CoA:oxalate CoA-transferase
LGNQWREVCAAMGRPELAGDLHFVDNSARVANLHEMIAVIEGWLQSLPDDETAIKLLERHRIPFAPVLSVQQAMNHPHLRERGTIRRWRSLGGR